MASSCHTNRITIVGAGVIGLTTACTVLKEYAHDDSLRLTIISDKFSPETTGDISAGFWNPYGIEKFDEQLLRWAGYTYNIFHSELFSTKAARSGVMELSTTIVNSFSREKKSNSETMKMPEFTKLVRHARLLDRHELELLSHLEPTSGFVMGSVAVEVRKYLFQLLRFLSEDHRVKLIKKKIHSLSELKNTTDVVINCTGLGSRYLVGDQKVRPARGQIIRVYAPWIKSVYIYENDEGMAYIIPQSDTVLLGGTFQLDDWNTNIVEADTKNILRRCAKILPAIEQIRHGKVQAGLRPYRDGGVRLEHEKTVDGLDVVHCYGHSGSGVTLSWGCARDVVEIVKRLSPPNQKQAVTANEDLPEHEQLWRLIPDFEYVILKAKV